MSLLWEKIESEFINNEHLNAYETIDQALIYRAKVPGGWFVVGGLPSQAQIINFFPDPAHLWTGSSLPQPPIAETAW